MIYLLRLSRRNEKLTPNGEEERDPPRVRTGEMDDE